MTFRYCFYFYFFLLFFLSFSGFVFFPAALFVNLSWAWMCFVVIVSISAYIIADILHSHHRQRDRRTECRIRDWAEHNELAVTAAMTLIAVDVARVAQMECWVGVLTSPLSSAQRRWGRGVDCYDADVLRSCRSSSTGPINFFTWQQLTSTQKKQQCV